jgi:phenylacetate-coenzyme A ligase PaaK-like adenylate-forming protein
MNYDEFLKSEPYSMDHGEKHRELTEILKQLTIEHIDKCPEYKQILSINGIKDHEDVEKISSYEDIPFLPVRMFKEYELKSIADEDVVKKMTSSGTTGQSVSRIYLDRETSASQQKVMTRIVSDFIGKKRLPMIILDTRAILKDRNAFSARGAGILGFSMFGRDRIYALDEEMNLDLRGLREFLKKHEGEDIFLFGFTFMIWQHFYQRMLELDISERPDLSRGVLIHGGGWKKLQSEAVSPEAFKDALHSVCGISRNRIYDYYGMVEQTGTIYMECEYGHLHTSNFSDVIIRDPEDWSVQPIGEKGIVEVVSSLPKSYPGHVLLTEDEGYIEGEDDCPCGRKGKYFRIIGRIKNAEIRGCSDTYADKISRK